MVVHPGAGAYICGEETALLDSLDVYKRQATFGLDDRVVVEHPAA